MLVFSGLKLNIALSFMAGCRPEFKTLKFNITSKVHKIKTTDKFEFGSKFSRITLRFPLFGLYFAEMTKQNSPQGQLSKNNLCKIVIVYLSISLNMCFGFSKAPSH